MCFKSAKAPAAPEVPTPVQPETSSDTVAAEQAKQRRQIRRQPSTYGSIFTSVLGDSSYGSNVSGGNVAALGA